MSNDPFGARTDIELSEGPTSFYSLARLEELGLVELDRLPFSIRILLENALRHSGGRYVGEDHVKAVAAWSPTNWITGWRKAWWPKTGSVCWRGPATSR